jgi:PIN like domain
LPTGILDPDWIPIVGERGWVVITNDRGLRTRPAEANLAITHKLKVAHLYKVGELSAWNQLTRLTTRWDAVEHQLDVAPDGPWWLSLRADRARVMQFQPGAVERG